MRRDIEGVFIYNWKNDITIKNYLLILFKIEKRMHKYVCKILQINGDVSVVDLKNIVIKFPPVPQMVNTSLIGKWTTYMFLRSVAIVEILTLFKPFIFTSQ